MTGEQTAKIAIRTTIRSIKKHPDAALRRIAALATVFLRSESHRRQLEVVKRSIERQDSSYGLMRRVVKSVDCHGLRKLLENLVVNSAWLGNQQVVENRERLRANVPWTILIDPTSACNLQCTGCWAAGYGRAHNLEYEVLDRVIREAKELGIYTFLYSGGEPLVRKDDLIRLAEAHDDCYFLAFTNGTLVDDALADDLVRVGNFALAFSTEGNETQTDFRRGTGSYRAMTTAMRRLRDAGVVFGFSTCYHAENCDSVAGDEYVDRMIELGALFGWYFTYIPVGAGAKPELIASASQRAWMYHRVRAMRRNKPIFLLDFWNDGEFVGGCAAGGRKYFHINARGAVEPCAFIHYSTVNIHDVSLVEALGSPLFLEYRRHQPFNPNHLRPCPLLDNPEKLRVMVGASGAASTEYLAPEPVEALTSKTARAAREWAPVAEEIWNRANRSESRAAAPVLLPPSDP